MNTKVIAIDGPPNSWKTTLINDIKQRYWFLNIKVFEETAREVMCNFPWSENNQDMFQDIIYHRESERVYQIKRDISLWIYDLILVDRTSLSWHIFSLFNENNWSTTKITPPIFHQIYDSVILFTDPIWDYKWSVDSFKLYNDSTLSDMFVEYIYKYDNVISTQNYLISKEIVLEHIENSLAI